MELNIPGDEELKNLDIHSLGEAKIKSPLKLDNSLFVDDDDKILVHSDLKKIKEYFACREIPPAFQPAGPRRKIFFNPEEITCGVVTCGGICPGLNDVIRTIVLTLQWQYGVKKVLGFRYGYEGMTSKARKEPVELNPSIVKEIQHKGGTILGSSRGHQNLEDMIKTLVKYKIKILFTIGGDGTLNGAHNLCKEIKKQGELISVIGIPKTIDNDIYCSETTFGFATAVEEARNSIAAANEEANAAFNGIGLVKLMGRDSGFIATEASLANSDVNFCLVPEVPFTLDGDKGFLRRLEKRLERKHHAVIVVAEGAGQYLMGQKKETVKDASGNVRHKDIGFFLKQSIKEYFKKKNIPITVKYIDPSYTIRSCPANAFDSVVCLFFGQNAVHAGMAGKTDMFISSWSQCFTHVPLTMAINKRKKINPKNIFWQTILAITD
jgi:6-phosphofructokinase 1